MFSETTAEYTEQPNETALTATFAVASEQVNSQIILFIYIYFVLQASKMKMGKNKTITSFSENRTLFHINHLPVIITMIGNSNVNLGMLYSFVPEIKRALEPLRNSILETEKEIS